MCKYIAELGALSSSTTLHNLFYTTASSTLTFLGINIIMFLKEDFLTYKLLIDVSLVFFPAYMFMFILFIPEKWNKVVKKYNKLEKKKSLLEVHSINKE